MAKAKQTVTIKKTTARRSASTNKNKGQKRCPGCGKFMK